jgi:hypothetical protein
VDSPQETRIRLLLVLAGLPEPCVNLIIRGRDGGWRRRYDLAYEELQLIVEYDGRQHAEDTRQWLTDIFRREELDQTLTTLAVRSFRRCAADAAYCFENVGGQGGPFVSQGDVSVSHSHDWPTPPERSTPNSSAAAGVSTTLS